MANSLVAVEAGARHVQGAANGYGERCGNADLFAIVAGLELKRGLQLLPQDRLAALTTTAHAIAELANLPPDHRQPYVGAAAFATKAGLHASAIARRADAYSHVDPGRVGNKARVLVSELAGRSNVLAKAGELGLDLDADPALGDQGPRPGQGAGAPRLRLRGRRRLLRAAGPPRERHLRPALHPGGLPGHGRAQGGRQRRSEATVRLLVDGERVLAVGEGVGPVHALDQALRRALAPRHPELKDVGLVDFKVRILDGRAGTRAVTRVLVTSADPDAEWTTVGVSDDIVTASWEALADGIAYGLLRAQVPAGR